MKDNDSSLPVSSSDSSIRSVSWYKSMFVMGIGAVVFLAVGLLGGYFLWWNSKKIASERIQPQPITAIGTQPSPTGISQVSIPRKDIPMPATGSNFPKEQNSTLAVFATQILPLNQDFQKELVGREIGQIFEKGGVYVIHTVPKGNTFSNPYVANTYAVNTTSFITVEKNQHITTYIADVSLPKESKRLTIEVGEPHVSSLLYLLDITDSLKKMPFTDPKGYVAKVKEITSFDFIKIEDDGSLPAEEFTFRSGFIESFYSDAEEKWTVFLTTDLFSGQLSKLQIKKGTQVVFDN